MTESFGFCPLSIAERVIGYPPHGAAMDIKDHNGLSTRVSIEVLSDSRLVGSHDPHTG